LPETEAEKALIKPARPTPKALAGPVRAGEHRGKIDAVVTAMNLHDIYNGYANQLPANRRPSSS